MGGTDRDQVLLAISVACSGSSGEWERVLIDWPEFLNGAARSPPTARAAPAKLLPLLERILQQNRQFAIHDFQFIGHGVHPPP